MEVKNCRNKVTICSKCGRVCDESHASDTCTLPSNCYHCHQPHPTYSKSCTKYLMEKEIIATKTKERVSFREARQIVSSMFIKPGVTYSTALQKRPSAMLTNNSAANKPTQNDLNTAQSSNQTKPHDNRQDIKSQTNNKENKSQMLIVRLSLMILVQHALLKNQSKI